MKKYLLAFGLIVTNLVVLQADPASQDSICFVQPNGDTLWTYLHGDEFYHWRSTIDGHVIMRDSNNYFRYAEIAEDSVLRPSTIIARNMEERNLLEKEYLNIHAEAIQQYIDSEIDRTYSIVLSDTLLFSPIQRVASKISDRQPVIGARKILTILMDFKDYSFTKTREEFDSLMNQRSGAVGPNYGSVRQYYQENSYGQLELQSTVVGPYRAISQRSYYDYKSNDSFWDWSVDIRQLVREAINHAKDIVDFSTLDGDNDGFVDCVHVVIAGEGLSSGSTNSYIWPHQSKLSSPIKQNGIKAETYIITPELQLKGKIAAMGTICHEIGHVFGAPDFYDKKEKFHAMGKYDIMDSGNKNGNGGNPSIKECGYCPAHHNPYTKSYIFKWVTPQVIDSTNRTYVLKSSTQNNNQIYRIDTKMQGEFFLLENRIEQGFDSDIPNGGLLIYHALSDLESSIERDDSINSQHPLKLYLINAAADVNPREGSYGNRADPRAFPTSISPIKTMFTSTTNPNALSWKCEETGVDICFINKLDFGNITFTVNPQIEGPRQLCGMKHYEVYGHIPDIDTISWSYSTDILESPMYPALVFSGGNKGEIVSIQRGETIPIEPIEPEDTIIQMAAYGLNNHFAQYPAMEPYVGTATLYATIKGGNGTYQMAKEIVLPEFATPSLLAQGSSLWRVNESRTLLEESCNEIKSEYIKWYVRYPNAETEVEFTGRSITLTPTEMGEMTVRIVNDCGCETSNETTYTYSVYNIRPLSYPNPNTTPTLPVNFEIERFGQTDEFYNLDLWHQTYGRVRHKVTNESNVNLPVGDLPEGWYQIVLSLDGQILDSGSVYIQH